MISISSIVQYALEAKKYFESGIPLTVCITNDTSHCVAHPSGFFPKEIPLNPDFELKKERISDTAVSQFFDVAINPGTNSSASFSVTKFFTGELFIEFELRKQYENLPTHILQVFYSWEKKFEATTSIRVVPYKYISNPSYFEVFKKRISRSIFQLGTISTENVIVQNAESGGIHVTDETQSLPFTIRFSGSGKTLQINLTDNPDFQES